MFLTLLTKIFKRKVTKKKNLNRMDQEVLYDEDALWEE